ncbi:ABC transporter ATP-binding protein [Arhodomonas sp. AD133]|uniref:ABC transporter ATP-binding protein n=1 Tax=Arhodomonas sp. AD133 TaxID=3415009 RepID=UPI003EBDA90C
MGNIQLSGVNKTFGNFDVIRDVDLSIDEREFVVFVGPSGSGKSTLLRLVAGLESVTSGSILIDGRDVTAVRPSRRGLAMVFQSYALYPHMSVRNNIAFGLKMAKEPKARIEEKVNAAARTLQLESYLDRKPRALSGGQRQRVAIGRAIVRDPTAFLFDEPLSNLDAALRVQMRLEIARLRQTLDATMVYVTHDQVEAMTLADKIVVLRDGAVEQIGSPLALYHHPVNRFVAGFIGSPTMNFLEARVTAVEETGVRVDVGNDGCSLMVPVAGGDVTNGTGVTLGVRPEHLCTGATNGTPALVGEVQVVERLGGVTYLYVRLADGNTVTVEAGGNDATRVGESVRVGLDGGTCHLFDAHARALPALFRHPIADAPAGTH